jgi:hypothetical protein
LKLIKNGEITMARVESFLNKDILNFFDCVYQTLNASMLSDPLSTCISNMIFHHQMVDKQFEGKYLKLTQQVTSHVAFGSGLSFLMEKAWKKPLFFAYLAFVFACKLTDKYPNLIAARIKETYTNYIKPAGEKISKFAESRNGRITCAFIAALRIGAPVATFLKTRNT